MTDSRAHPTRSPLAERVRAFYRLAGDQATALARAQDICLEQTVELPDALVTDPHIRENIFGKVEEFTPLAENSYQALISYPADIVGTELTQLLNVLFGNISLKPGIRLERFELPPALAETWHGPRFGQRGLRARLNVPERPLLCTALKPMGMTVSELAELSYQLALGGIDIIKDDHGLADQPFSPYEARVAECAQAVTRANEETGGHSVYAPNVTAPAPLILERALFARRHGAGALLICPGITGLDGMRQLAGDERVDLPLLSHPSFQGSFVGDPAAGISHYCLFGQLNRLAGADVAIFPNAGGRFLFSDDDCRALVRGCEEELGRLAPIFPAPAGGMSLERVPAMRAMYGRNVMFLIGGGLRSHSPDLVANCRYFRELAEQI